MKEKIIIKNHEIGKGKPLICVPIVEKKKEDILAAAKNIVKRGAAIIEWRMDWYGQITVWESALEVLRELSGICRDTILLCTFRSKKQGGELEITEEGYIGLLYNIAKSGCADLLDVEFAEISDGKAIIKSLQEQSVCVLASQHHFFHTPAVEEIEQELYQMKELGADIGKIAVMPQKDTDVLRLMEATMNVKERYPFYPVVTMAMGRKGLLSRIGGQVFGSCITFGTAGQASAPGQLPMEDVAVILDKIAENLEYGNET